MSHRPKTDSEKVGIAARLRAETTMTLGQIAQRLKMGTPNTLSENSKREKAPMKEQKSAKAWVNPFERENDGEGCGRSFFTCRAAGKAYDLRRHQKTNEGTKNMGGRKGIGQKEQTQPDLGPAGLVRFANMTIPLTDPCYGENCQARRKIISFY